MRRIAAIAAIVCAVAVSALVAYAQQPRTAAVASTSIDEVLQAVRSDLQNSRSDVIAKNVTLTTDQAAKFWPLFEAYQREQNAVMDEQLRGIQRYIEAFDSLDDAGALSLIDAHLDRDARMIELRRKWLGDFQRAIGAKLAVRVMQIDRRLSLVHQMQFAAKIPLSQ
jgi:Spy/CpxP family protein refolding chaperone